MNKISIFVLSLAIVITFLSCGEKDKKNSDGKVNIVFWHSFVSSTIPALNELIDKFEKEHPNINIDAQYIPSGDALI